VRGSRVEREIPSIAFPESQRKKREVQVTKSEFMGRRGSKLDSNHLFAQREREREREKMKGRN
jgi:ligand-binding sensor domain-containing protein